MTRLTHEQREDFIRGRIAKHDVAMFEVETGAEVAQCTAEEMWETKTTYALKKEGNVRAKTVHDNLKDAELALADSSINAKKGEKFIIETRPGERKRCANFCQVSEYCTQYQNYLKEQP